VLMIPLAIIGANGVAQKPIYTVNKAVVRAGRGLAQAPWV
jgi:hypothetical protein